MVAPRPADRPPFWRRHAALFLILAVHGALGAAADTVLSPYPDFIDHWMQSRVLELAYYQHPPMIAWLIRGLTLLFGESEAGLEAGALLTNLGVLAAAYALAHALYGRLGALFALLLLEATFYFFAGAPMLQQEQPLMLAWLGALGCLLAYRRTGRGAWLLAMGVCGGLGALSKYTMIVFYLGVLAWALLVKERRRELLNPWQYAGGLVALALFSPVLVWNAERDWVSFRLQLAKGMSKQGVFFGKHLLEFTGGALLLFSAVLIAWGAWRLWRRWRAQGLRDDPFTLVATIGAVALGFFWLAMIRGSFPDPKWANVGFLCFYVLLGGEAARLWREGARREVRRVLGAAFALNLGLVALAGVHTAYPFLPVEREDDPSQQVFGWHRTGAQVEALLAEHGQPLPAYVVTIHYQLASQMALHLRSRPYSYSLEKYLDKYPRSVWSDPRKMTTANTILVCYPDRCADTVAKARRNLGLVAERLGAVETVILGIPRRQVAVYRIAAILPDAWQPAER